MNAYRSPNLHRTMRDSDSAMNETETSGECKESILQQSFSGELTAGDDESATTKLAEAIA